MCIKCICQALNPLLVPWHALKFNLQLAICCFMPILAALVVIVGTLIATTCTQPLPHPPMAISNSLICIIKSFSHQAAGIKNKKQVEEALRLPCEGAGTSTVRVEKGKGRGKAVLP